MHASRNAGPPITAAGSRNCRRGRGRPRGGVSVVLDRRSADAVPRDAGDRGRWAAPPGHGPGYYLHGFHHQRVGAQLLRQWGWWWRRRCAEDGGMGYGRFVFYLFIRFCCSNWGPFSCDSCACVSGRVFATSVMYFFLVLFCCSNWGSFSCDP